MDKSSPSCWLTRVSKFLMIFPAGYFSFLSTNVFESLYRLDIWMVRRSGPEINKLRYKVYDLINCLRYNDISIMTYKSLLVLENTYKRQKRRVQNLGFVHHSDTTIMLHGNCMICISFNL